MLEELFGFITYRYFCDIDTKEELSNLYENPFIKPMDFVFCKEDNNYYVYETLNNYDYYGKIVSVEHRFRLISRGNQNRTNITFFHRHNVGDTITLKDGKSGTIVDVKYSVFLKDVTYVIRFEDNSTTEILSIYIDGASDKEYPPIQSLILKSDLDRTQK